MTIKKKNVLKNIAPAVVVLAAGLLGVSLFMDSNLKSDTASALSSIAPAAGITSTDTTNLLSATDFPPMPDVTMNEIHTPMSEDTIEGTMEAPITQ